MNEQRSLVMALLLTAAVGSAWLVSGTLSMFSATTDATLTISFAHPTPTPTPDPCQHLTGAVWTTDASGQSVNENQFKRKEDVYLRGGARGQGEGLPDGRYFYRVTTPNGDPLSEIRPATAEHGSLTELLPLAPFDDSPNGSYKAWVSPSRDFEPRCSKTDNFRLFARGKP